MEALERPPHIAERAGAAVSFKLHWGFHGGIALAATPATKVQHGQSPV
jgi:hypothetical protein